MDREKIAQAMADRARGERARVIFDLLMETIGADMSITIAQVMERLEEILRKEQDAIRFLLPTQRMPEKGETAYDYVQSFHDEVTGVSLSD